MHEANEHIIDALRTMDGQLIWREDRCTMIIKGGRAYFGVIGEIGEQFEHNLDAGVPERVLAHWRGFKQYHNEKVPA